MREGIMLCYPFEEKRLLKWASPYFIQTKLDGERCRAICHGNMVRLISSEGNEFAYLPHINEALRKLDLKGVELDGELYCHGMSFPDIHSICSRKVNPHPEFALMEYHIFDIVTQDEQILRLKKLEELRQHIVEYNCQEELKVVGSIAVSTMDAIMEVFDDYIESGYEGFVLREKNNIYQRKRSTMIMKFKPHKEDVYEIVGWQEEISSTCSFCTEYLDLYENYTFGEIPPTPPHACSKNKPKNSLGAFICRGDDSSTFAVGSGPALTREARESLWKEKADLVGQYLQVKYQNLTPGRGVPRFPVALRVLDLKAQS